jgi:transcription-repair coupling factor (superfamily II helicase)
MGLRLQIYRRIGNLASEADLRAMREELIDRFGPLPAAVEGLLYQIEVKLLAQACAATAVVAQGDRIEIRLPYLVEINRERIARELGADVEVTRTAVAIATGDRSGRRKASGPWMPRVLEVLRQLSANVSASQALAQAAQQRGL